MSKEYLDEHGLELYDENIKDYIETKITDLVREGISSIAPSSANIGDFWTELINNNEQKGEKTCQQIFKKQNEELNKQTV